MIQNHDRSGWFGASDARYIMGGWETASFAKWWMIKLGIARQDYVNTAMLAGTYHEHGILDCLNVPERDRQIKIRALRLRVNLDGEDRTTITEVKTHGSEVFHLNKGYWQQCQIQMYAAQKDCRIAAYRLLPEDYDNFFLPIDRERITLHPIAYEEKWVKDEFLPRVKELSMCLKRGTAPCRLCLKKR